MLRKLSLLLLFAVSILLTLDACKKQEPEPEPEPTDETDDPVAAFETNIQGLEVTFTFTGSDADSYTWSFDDGNTSEEESPTHTYQNYGVYSVQLTVNNDEGVDDIRLNVELDDEVLLAGPELVFDTVDGAFYAVNMQRLWQAEGEIKLIKTGLARAWCRDGASYVNVGDVKFGQEDYKATLSRATDNSYDWIESPDDHVGFKKAYGPSWSIQGGGSFGAVNGLSNVWPFPKTKELTSSQTVDAAMGYILTHDGSITDADSILFSVYGPSGTVTKRLDGAASEASFTPTDLASLGKGSGTAQIAAYKIYTQVLGPRTYVVINEAATQLPITIE